ncbi:MAG: sigma-70 family RNA polymerase sigma factor [Bacteroidetes bacterium]|nr:sigma-70 family RNA polymerase sigma factor [Bacteroidota bacterium]
MENEIIYYLSQRDKRGISLLYDHYSIPLYGIVRRMIPYEEVAQDVLQEVFVKIWENADKYDREKGRLFTWVSQVTRNAAIDWLRSPANRQKGFYPTDNQSIENILPNETASDISDSGLQKTIDGLENSYRQLIQLAYFKGYTQVEIAKELAMPLGTVKTRIRAAIHELRRVLKNDIVLAT